MLFKVRVVKGNYLRGTFPELKCTSLNVFRLSKERASGKDWGVEREGWWIGGPGSSICTLVQPCSCQEEVCPEEPLSSDQLLMLWVKKCHRGRFFHHPVRDLIQLAQYRPQLSFETNPQRAWGGEVEWWIF